MFGTFQSEFSSILNQQYEAYIYASNIFLGSDISSMSSGRRFMIDLLVSSLMADGGLEMALSAAIKCK